MMITMRLALIGDIHVYSTRIRVRDLLCKRALGHVNLLLRRRRQFNHDLLGPLLERVQAIDPAALLMSGDVTTSSLADEFEQVDQRMAKLVATVPTVLVPGNHDRYTFASSRTRRMETMLARLVPGAFPDVRDLTDGWRLLSLDSAVPNRFFSRGALGDQQLAAAEGALSQVQPGQGVVILCHYPVLLPKGTLHGWSHDLKEMQALRKAVLACRGRVVFLHGHIHQPWFMAFDTDAHVPAANPATARIISINAGSPCMVGPQYPLGQGFWQIDLPDDPLGQLGLIHHLPASASLSDWTTRQAI